MVTELMSSIMEETQNLPKGKTEFTKAEIARIEELLKQKSEANPSAQKGIRAKLRNMGFYITDFSESNDGYDVEKFYQDIKNQLIKVKE